MKLYIYTLIFMLSISVVTAVDSSYCSDDCFSNSKELFSVHSLYGGDNAIMYKEDVVANSYYDWQFGKIVDFSLDYDPLTELLTYTLDGDVLNVQIDGDDAFKYLIIQGQTSFYGGNSMRFIEMTVDGDKIEDLEVTSGINGVKVMLDQKYFSLSGKVIMDAESNTNKNMAGMSIFMLESKKSGRSGSRIASVPDNDDYEAEIQNEEVPEFGVIAAGIALIGSVAIFVLKRKN